MNHDLSPHIVPKRPRSPSVSAPEHCETGQELEKSNTLQPLVAIDDTALTNLPPRPKKIIKLSSSASPKLSRGRSTVESRRRSKKMTSSAKKPSSKKSTRPTKSSKTSAPASTTKARLMQTSTKYPGSTLLRGSEAYTTKQCGNCGLLDDNVKGKEQLKCRGCSKEGDRDVLGARNICLRFLKCQDHDQKNHDSSCVKCKHIKVFAPEREL